MEVALDEIGEMISAGPTEVEASAVSDCISVYLHSKSLAKRVVFVRRYWYGDAISKIASDYGFSESKVKSMLMRMRKELKKHFERNGISI